MKLLLLTFLFVLFIGSNSPKLLAMEDQKKVVHEQNSTPTEYMLKTISYKVYAQQPVESCEVNQKENTPEINPTAFMMQTVFYKIHSQKKHKDN